MKSPLALLLLPALLLAACDSKTTPSVNALSGMMADGDVDLDSEGNFIPKSDAWTGGAGSVIAAVLPNLSDSAVSLASTSLGADGKFSFATLPAPTADTLSPISTGSQEQPGCMSEIKFSDPAAKGIELSVGVKAEQKAGLARQLVIDTAAKIDKTSFFVYVDRDLKISGIRRCTFGGGNVPSHISVDDYDVQLYEGWNSLVGSSKTETVRTTTTTTSTTRVGNLGDARWYLIISFPQSLSLQKSRLPSFPLFR